MGVNAATEWRWRKQGVTGAAERLVHALLLIRRLERQAGRDAVQLAAFRQGKDPDRVRTHTSESKRGGFPDALVRPRKRKGKAELRAEAERLITKE